MFKRTVIIALAALYILGLTGTVLAEPDGNHRKGKYLFRKSCRSCHIEGGKAKVLEPLTFTMAEWDKVFKPETAAKYPCKPEWDKIGQKDVQDIFTYLYKFAKDSPTPAKCN